MDRVPGNYVNFTSNFLGLGSGGPACHTSPRTSRLCAWGTHVCLLLQGPLILFHFYLTVSTQSCHAWRSHYESGNGASFSARERKLYAVGTVHPALPGACPGCRLDARSPFWVGGQLWRESGCTCKPLASLCAGSSGALWEVQSDPRGMELELGRQQAQEAGSSPGFPAACGP